MQAKRLASAGVGDVKGTHTSHAGQPSIKQPQLAPPARKAPASQQSTSSFQYTTVAFKSSASNPASKPSKFFAGQPVSKGYKSLEVVAGDAAFLLQPIEEPSQADAAQPSPSSTLLFELVLEPVPIGALEAALEAAFRTSLLPASHEQATISRGAKLIGVKPSLLHANRSLKAEVLSLSMVQLQQRISTLRQLLGIAREELFDVLLQQPYILRLEPLDVFSKVHSLVQLLALQQREELAALVLSAPDVLTQVKPYTDVLQALQECLHLRDNAAAARLARQEPQLLCCVPARFKGVVSALMQLSMPFEHARQLVSQAPYILAMNPASLHSNIRMLLGTFQLDRQAVASMTVQLPGLLAASPGVFAISCQRLKRTAYGSAAWRPQLLKLVQQPRNLAVAVSFDSSRYERLEYLTRTGRDKTISLKSTLAMPDDEFLDIYPGFSQWRSGQRG